MLLLPQSVQALEDDAAKGESAKEREELCREHCRVAIVDHTSLSSASFEVSMAPLLLPCTATKKTLFACYLHLSV